VLAFAHDEPGRRWAPGAHDVTAASDGSLTGTKEGVLHGARADRLVVSAVLPGGGTGLFVVDPSASGLEVSGYPLPDGGRAARVVLDATPATRLGEGADATLDIASVQDVARIMAANQALGAMQTQLSATTDYLKSRKQFGVPLNSFQALTFRAADMYVSLELTQSLVDWATMSIAAGDIATVADAAARVSLQVSRAGRHVGQEAIQLHGGIAMTAEYNVGMITAHLTVLDHLLGDAGHHLKVLDATLMDHDDIDPLGDPVASRDRTAGS
jgi:alkylation response protein AidB-like acyl-CoA dehydrogenase